MSEENLTITSWLAHQFFDMHKDNGWLVAELDRRLPGPLCSIAAISPDDLTYINRTGEPNDGIEVKFKNMASWLDNVPEGSAMKDDSSSLSYALRAPKVPGRVLTAILLCGPTEDAQARLEAIQRVLEVVRQEAERKTEEAARQEEEKRREEEAAQQKEEQGEAVAECMGDGKEGGADADRDSE